MGGTEVLMKRSQVLLSAVLLVLAYRALPAPAQEKSVRPGINKSYEDPNVEEFVKRFEVESREIYVRRNEIVEACGVKPGMAVADVGAGTGLFTRLFAKAVGNEGKVYAVDIAKNFVKHIEKIAREENLPNITGIVCTADSAELPENSVDLAFVCDTYHHFEFPLKTMTSIHKALRPGGRVVVIDFVRIEGVSSAWVLDHVRAGQEVVEKEIESCGFRKVESPKTGLKENYLVVFEKAAAK
jgi:ubiquinone/menaquinone biosynthesis C-methylase UbiE